MPMFAGRVPGPCEGTSHDTPFSTVRGANHQHALEFPLEGPATTVMKPPGYAVIFIAAFCGSSIPPFTLGIDSFSVY